MKHLFFSTIFTLFFIASGFSNTGSIEKASIEDLGNNTYKIGLISFNSKTEELSFPAKLEQNEALIEYLLTTSQGKIHETLFVTDILPFNLNVAMKLLNYKESKELFMILDADYTPTNKPFVSTPEQKKMSRFSITVSWKIDGKSFNSDVTTLLTNTNNKRTMPNSPWIYSGSYIFKGNYKPDLSGDIIAVFTDRSAMASYSGKDRNDDTLWLPNKTQLPPLGTKVTLTFKPLNR